MRAKCLQVAAEFIREQFNSNPSDFKMIYEGTNKDSQHIVHVVHQDYLKALVPGGHDKSRELCINDKGIVVRALKWQ